MQLDERTKQKNTVYGIYVVRDFIPLNGVQKIKIHFKKNRNSGIAAARVRKFQPYLMVLSGSLLSRNKNQLKKIAEKNSCAMLLNILEIPPIPAALFINILELSVEKNFGGALYTDRTWVAWWREIPRCARNDGGLFFIAPKKRNNHFFREVFG
ncbi:MAG: hypothetical protein LBK18_00775 [Prevotellaceae bacterium]|nr:hypothetical protein [Prevotellaceae bacterium]